MKTTRQTIVYLLRNQKPVYGTDTKGKRHRIIWTLPKGYRTIQGTSILTDEIISADDGLQHFTDDAKAFGRALAQIAYPRMGT